jgi:hypothetical protein
MQNSTFFFFLHDNFHLMKFVMQIDFHGSYVSACASDFVEAGS